MWKNLPGTEYFLLFEKDLEVCVTNYVTIWRIQFSEESFLACLKESNFGLGIDENELVEKGKKILLKLEGLKPVQPKDNGNKLLVTLTTMSFGFPIRLRMNLTEGSKELFFEKITLQLLKTIQDLHSSQKELRESLKKKDLEIEEYKCEGGEIALRFLKTIPFNDKEHALKHPVYSEHFGSEDIPDCLINKNVDVPETHVVKAEPNNELNVKQDSTETNGTTPEVKTESEVIKTEPVAVKIEESVKIEPPPDIKQEEVTSEPITLTQSSTRIQMRPGITGISPSKRQRKKLNL